MTSETQRILEKYQDKINKLEDLLKLKNEFIEESEYLYNAPPKFHILGEISKKISELEKELDEEN